MPNLKTLCLFTCTGLIVLCVTASGCKKSEPASGAPMGGVVGTATPSSVTIGTPTAPAALALAASTPLKKGIDAMPELANPATPAQTKINAAMKNADADALSMLKQCKSYTRTVKPTMLGPGYLSVWTNEGWDCGAYPNVSISVRVFDLNTGEAVDWSKLVSGAGVKSYSDTGADGKQGAPLALVYPALKAKYLKDPDNSGECQTAYDDNQSFMIWPEAHLGIIQVQAFDLPHVTQACANDMTLTIDEAKALGFNADFLNAVAAASKQPGAEKLMAPGN